MSVLAALAAVKEIRLNVVASGEQRAAGRVRSGVLAVGAINTLGDGGLNTIQEDVSGKKWRKQGGMYAPSVTLSTTAIVRAARSCLKAMAVRELLV